MRPYGWAIIFWKNIFNGVATIFGSSAISPAYESVCKRTAQDQEYECRLENLLSVWLNFGYESISSSSFWTAAATIAIAAFTLMLKRSTDNLWAVSERQAKIGQESVKAAVVSYQVIAANAERQLRAYVTAAGGEIAPYRHPKQHWGLWAPYRG